VNFKSTSSAPYSAANASASSGLVTGAAAPLPRANSFAISYYASWCASAPSRGNGTPAEGGRLRTRVQRSRPRVVRTVQSPVYDPAVSFHLQIEQSHRRARLFNLTEDDLRRRLFEPWGRGVFAHLAESEWDPAKSRLIVLEGRSLEPSELALGRGWNNAMKIGRDVTVELMSRQLRRPSKEVAVLAATPEARAVTTSLLEELGVRVVGAEEPGVQVVVIVVEERLTAQQAFEIGLAIGARGDSAILVQLGAGDPPPELAHLAPLRLVLENGAQKEALAERLRLTLEQRVTR
jgi:hypothetical protein